MSKQRERNFTQHISAVVSIEEYEVLKQVSDREQVSIGKVIRKLINDYKESALEKDPRQQELTL